VRGVSILRDEQQRGDATSFWKGRKGRKERERNTHDDGSLHPGIHVIVQPDLDLGFLEESRVSKKRRSEVSVAGGGGEVGRRKERRTRRLKVLEDDVDGLHHYTLVSVRHAERIEAELRLGKGKEKRGEKKSGKVVMGWRKGRKKGRKLARAKSAKSSTRFPFLCAASLQPQQPRKLNLNLFHLPLLFPFLFSPLGKNVQSLPQRASAVQDQGPFHFSQHRAWVRCRRSLAQLGSHHERFYRSVSTLSLSSLSS